VRNVRAEVERVAIGVDHVADGPVALDARLYHLAGAARQQPLPFIGELVKVALEVEVHSPGSMFSALDTDTPHTVGRRQHDPSIAIFTLRLVKVQYVAPESGEGIGGR
jgi:hypothetical protein